MSNKYLFGLPFDDVTITEASNDIVSQIPLGISRQIFFVNPHCVNVAAKDKLYYDTLLKADTLYADGSGMKIASKFSGTAFVDNVNGTDLFPAICHEVSKTDISIALLGSKPGIAEKCAKKIMEASPGLKVVWTHNGYFDSKDEPELIKSLNDSGASILFVARGVPEQELWIARNNEKIIIPVKIAVGALFDFYSGSMPRAPYLMRKMGIEWVFRLMLEPRRMFGRYIIGNPVFLLRLLVLRMGGIKKLQQHLLH